jgi:hypothetical protein
MTGGRLAGLAKPAPVVGDHPMTSLQQHRDLQVPGTATERIAVHQYHRSLRPVVLVVQVDGDRVLLAHDEARHAILRFTTHI